MTAPGNTTLLLVLLAVFVACTAYAAGRLHQWYRTGLDRDEAYREGYDTATRSVFTLAARIIGPRRDKAANQVTTGASPAARPAPAADELPGSGRRRRFQRNAAPATAIDLPTFPAATEQPAPAGPTVVPLPPLSADQVLLPPLRSGQAALSTRSGERAALSAASGERAASSALPGERAASSALSGERAASSAPAGDDAALSALSGEQVALPSLTAEQLALPPLDPAERVAGGPVPDDEPVPAGEVTTVGIPAGWVRVTQAGPPTGSGRTAGDPVVLERIADPVPAEQSSGRHFVPDELVQAPTYRLTPDRVARAKVRDATNVTEGEVTTRLPAPRPRSS